MASVMDYDAPLRKNESEMERTEPTRARLYSLHQILNLPATADTTEMFKMFRAKGNVQGICPDGWHIPKKDEWDKLQAVLKGDKELQALMTDLTYNEAEPFPKHAVSFSDFLGYYINVGNLNFSIEENDKSPVKARAITEYRKDNEIGLEVNPDEDYAYWVTLRCAKD